MKVSHIDERRHFLISSGITLFAFLLLLLVFFLVELSYSPSAPNVITDSALSIQLGGSENEGKLVTSQRPAGSSAAKNIVVVRNSETSIANTIERYRSGTTSVGNSGESEFLPASGNNTPGENGTVPGIESAGINFNLSNRALMYAPKIISDTKEQGKVVVDISVNQSGEVIEANPNGRGTTTSSASLKQRAKELALLMKFNADKRFEEQKGTVTIIFAFE